MTTIGTLDTEDFIKFKILSDTGEYLKEFEGASYANNTLYGDRVEWNTTLNKAALIERSQHTRLVGLLDLKDKTIYGFTSNKSPIYMFYPFDQRYPPFRVGCSEKDKTRNRIGIVKLLEWIPGNKFPRGSLERIIGSAGDLTVETQGLLAHGSPCWSSKAELDIPFGAMNFGTEEEYSETGTIKPYNRKIFGPEWKTINIDPPGCNDIDDVISMWQHPYGDWLIAISIADVDEFVPEETLNNLYACSTAQTIYVNGEAVRPMLPTQFSEGLCSLLPNKQSKTISLIAKWNGTRLIIDGFKPSQLTNNHSFTYESVMEPDATKYFPINVLKDIVRYLGGNEAAVDSHKWIEELMVLYNKEAAKVLIKQQNGIIRAHSQPSQERLSAAVAVVGSEVAAKIATAAAKYFPAAAVDAAADTAANNSLKHWSLGNSFYCHATSPIRRYADLVNQRILKGQLTINNMATISKYLNERQKVIKQVDRDIFFIKQLNENGKIQKGTLLWKTEKGSWKLWVPAWERMITYRPGLCYEDEHCVDLKEGLEVNFTIYFDQNRPNWKQRLIVQILGD